MPDSGGQQPFPAQRSASSLSTASNSEGDPLSGHVGHLNSQQQQSLNAFKALIFAQGLYTEDPVASHDTATLLRFLRARKFDAAAALKHFKEAENYRHSNHVEAFFTQHDIETYEQARRVYPTWTGRRTKRGLPFFVYRINDLDKKTMNKFLADTNKGKSDRSTDPPAVLALFECLLQLVTPLLTQLRDRPNLETPITQSFQIVDISGVSLKQFLSLRGHLGHASTLATTTYPETLNTILLVGAPPFIGTVWQFIAQWFDAAMRSKIHILETNQASNLQRICEFVELEHIPKIYGGNLDWLPGDLPNVDPEIVRAFGVDKNKWPVGPIKLEGADIVAVGTTKEGKLRKDVIGSLRSDAYPQTSMQ